MPKTKEQKQDIINHLQELLDKAKSIVFSTFSKVPVSKQEELRMQMREQGITYDVCKKTLLKKALQTQGLAVELDEWIGNIGVAGSMNDEVGAARILVKAIKDKEMEGLEVKAGILEGRIIEFSQVKALAALPSRKDLIAKIAGSINAPLSGLVNVLQGNQRKLIYVLSNIRGTK